VTSLQERRFVTSQRDHGQRHSISAKGTTQKQRRPEQSGRLSFWNATGRSRTCNPELRRLVLYPVELRSQPRGKVYRVLGRRKGPCSAHFPEFRQGSTALGNASSTPHHARGMDHTNQRARLRPPTNPSRRCTLRGAVQQVPQAARRTDRSAASTLPEPSMSPAPAVPHAPSRFERSAASTAPFPSRSAGHGGGGGNCFS
jgi:hypothetical protein